MITLFSEPFDLNEIDRILCDDDFLSLAHLTVGREDNWRAALDQVARLLPIFEGSTRDSAPIYRIASILAQRTAQLRKPAERLEEATTKLGLLPGSRYWNVLQFEAAEPQTQEAKDKKWLEEYRAKTGRPPNR